MTSTLGAPPTNGASQDGALVHAKDAALEKTADVRRKIGSQVTDRVREQADERSTAVGSHISTIAEALEETSSKLDSQGESAPAKALDTVTEQVRHIGSYLTESNGEQLLHDLEDAARKRPWATAATLFGLGFAASRVLGASSRNRYTARNVGSSNFGSTATTPNTGYGTTGVSSYDDPAYSGGINNASY
ncbi:MAG: hypothetical protein JWN41_835 [Thermoleophilia bacterium]|nr:hypothetical protein [Thermoleophilia bacterium]